MGDIVITPASNDVNSTAGTLIIRTSDAQAMSLKTSDTDRVYITSAGNVGIGLTNPSEKTQITGNLKISPLSSSWAEGISFSMPQVSTWGGLRWRRERANADGNHYVGYIGSDATDDLVFGSNNAGTQIDNNIRITKAGRVGINTSAPLAILSVGNGSLNDVNVPVQISSAGPGTEKWFGANRSGGYGLLLGYYEGSSLAGSGAYVRQVTSDPLHFLVNNSTTAMSIISNGNIGMGVTTPSQKLDVNGAIIAGINNSYGAYTRTPGGVLKPWFATASANTFFYNTNVSGSTFWQNAADTATLMSLTEQGRLGINTNDPSGRLHVLDTSLYAPSLTWNSTAAAIIRSENGQIAFGSDSSNPYGIWQQVRTTSNTARPLLLNPLGGNIGIGTTNPFTKLRVDGSFSQKASGSSNIQEYKNIVNFVLDNNGAGGYVIKTPFQIGNSFEMAIVHVKGYGYGTSSLFDFKVVFYDYGPSNAPINYSLVDLGNDGSPKYLAKDANNYMQICFGSPSDPNRYFYRFTVDCITTRNSTDWSQGWGMSQTTGTNFGFASTGLYLLDSPISFNVSNNYVGIGKTNPAVKLDVAGTIRSSTSEVYSFGSSDNVSLRAASSVNVLGIYTSNVERLRVDANGYLGIGLAPSTLLSVGGAGSTSAASGLTFGADASANLYRVGSAAIKTDGSLYVAGLLYNSNSAYYSSLSKSTNANWGQYTVVLGNASYSSQLVQVSVNGGNVVWAGTFLVSSHISYRPTEVWNNVKLLEYSTYNANVDDVTLLVMSNTATNAYGAVSLVLKTNPLVNGGYGTGYANTIAVTSTGPAPNEFVLSSSSWSSPYTYTIATSLNTKQIYTTEAGNVGIGTTSPVVKLEVAGALRITGVGQIGPVNGYGFALFNAGTNTFAGQLYGRANGIQFTDILGNNSVYIASGGNVGIGSTAPTAKLEVYSTSTTLANFNGNQATQLFYLGSTSVSQYTDIILKADNGQSEIFRGGSAYSSYGGTSALNIWNSNGPIALHPSNSGNVLYLSTLSTVGINTANPGATLQIYGGTTANNNKSLMAGDAANSLSYVPYTTAGGWNNASVAGGSILFNSLGSTWLVGTHNGPAMRIATNNISFTNPLGGIDFYVGSGANNGISNTNPKFALHVNGDVTIPNARYLNFNPGELQGTAFNRAIVSSYSDNTATSQPKQIGIILHNDSNTDDTFSPALAFGSKSNSSNYSQTTAIIAGRRRSFAVDGNWHGGELWFWTATSNDAGGGSNVGIPTANPAMVINSVRNVGIGTSNPGDKLQVNLNSGENILANLAYNGVSALNKVSFRLSELGTPLGEFSAVRDGTSYQVKLQTVNNQPLSFGTNSVTRMVIDTAGNVGIGSASPTALLNIRASNPATIGATPSGTNLLIDSSTNNYITFRNSADNGTYAGLVFLDNNVGGYITFRNYTAEGAISGSDSMIYGSFQDHIFQNGYVNETLYNRTETMRIKQNGYVGIGITNPSARLQVVQNNGGGVAAILLSQDESTIQGPSANTQIRMGSNLVLNASNVIPIATNGTERIRIDVSGNVGIGTAVPYSRLDLQLASAATRYLTLSTNDGQGSFNGFGLNFRIADQGHDIAQIKGEYENSAGGGYGGLFIATRSAGTLYNRLAINDNGRVGIGVSYGTTLLSVGGAGSTTAASGLTFGGDASVNLYRLASNVIRTDANFQAGASIYATTYLQAGNGNIFPNSYAQNLVLNVGNNAASNWESYPITLVKGCYVGIGTNVPSGKLHVVSSVAGETVLRADGTNGVLFSVVDDLSDSLMSVNNSAGLPVLEVFADDRVVAGQYGSGDLVILNNKVGIGRTVPGDKLDVNGNIRIGVTTNNIIGTSANFGLQTQSINIHPNSSTDTLYLRYLSAGNYQLQTVTSSANGGNLHLQPYAGNVGIGTTSPAALLDLYSAASRIRFNRGSAYNMSFGMHDSTLSALSIKNSSDAATIAYFQYDGKVGIGITNPSYQFQVSGGDVSFSSTSILRFGTVSVLNVTSNPNDIYANIRVIRNESSVNTDGMYVNYNSAGTTSAHLRFYANAATERMRIDASNGNVGIGVTNPDLRLHVEATNAYPSTAGTTPSGFLSLRAKTAGGTHGMYMGVADVSPWGSWIQCSDSANLATNYPLLLNPNGGNVGVGTRNPTSRLHVVETTQTGVKIQFGTAGASAIMNTGQVNHHIALFAPYNSNPASVSNNGAKWGIIMHGSLDNINADIAGKAAAIYAVSEEDAVGGAGYNRKVGLALHTSAFDLANTERVRINNVGNVGIGLTNPTQKLEVAGYSMAGAGSYRTSTYADNGGAYLYFGTSAAPTNLGTIGAYSSAFNINSLNGDISFQYNGSEKMRVAQGGTVGIGTASTVGKLDVYDDTNAGHVVFVRNNNTGSNAYSAFVLRRDGGNNGIVLFTNSSNRSTDGGLGNSTIRTDNGKLLLGAGATTYHSLETNGNVGIGLTNPAAARMHIKGDGTNPVLRVETALLVAGTTTASKTFVGWMPIQTGAANPGDTVFIPLFK